MMQVGTGFFSTTCFTAVQDGSWSWAVNIEKKRKKLMLGVYVNAFRSRCEFGKNFEN
jgi:hypothetical protein